VRRGQLLAEIDPRDVRNAFEQAEADLEVARAQVATTAAQRKRIESLAGSGVLSPQDLENAQLAETNARAQLLKAETNLRLATEKTGGVTIRTFSFLLAGIALVSLLVGGIGIMNIMLVSVTERTREIGVRKALGARKRDILLQFLIEALVLCLAGGAMGVLVGVSGAVALQKLAGWNTSLSANAIVIAFLFSAAVGIFFGLWPARRAAGLDPIDALRYE